MTSREEREECVVFTHADSAARVYSHTPDVWKACERVSGRLILSHKRKGKEEARDYEVPLADLHRVLNWLGETARKLSA
jgi:hypothetical protein